MIILYIDIKQNNADQCQGQGVSIWYLHELFCTRVTLLSIGKFLVDIECLLPDLKKISESMRNNEGYCTYLDNDILDLSLD